MPSKKRKAQDAQELPNHGVDTSKPSAIFQPIGGRSWTLSVALPGSIIANAQSHDQKTFLAGTIGRALAVFNVDEVVIFDDEPPPKTKSNASPTQDDAYTAYSDPGHFLSHVLSYLETPPYLRKYLFPIHKNLKTAGTLPSLDMPHHLRTHEWCEYREGVTYADEGEHADAYGESGSSKKKEERQGENRESAETKVDVGLADPISLPFSIPPNTRITLKLPSQTTTPLTGGAVAPTAPREESGYYWGYNIRRCSSLSAIFTECGYDGGYDLSFGTSERGQPLQELLSGWASGDYQTPPFDHLMVVFGGVAGLEAAMKADPEMMEMQSQKDVEVRDLFDFWVNVCPGQGSRTIRTEEAVWMGLMGLRGFVTDTLMPRY